jgi:hypothetical protein
LAGNDLQPGTDLASFLSLCEASSAGGGGSEVGCRVSKKLKLPLTAFFRPLLAIGFETIFLSKNLVIRIQKTQEKDNQSHGPP